MTTRVRFCLSYDLVAHKINIISARKRIFDTRTLSMTLRLHAKVLLHVWYMKYHFYDTTLPTE